MGIRNNGKMNMSEIRQPSRIAAVQPPIIPIIGELIRQNPGTISLGQGVAFYGPPPEVQYMLKSFFTNPGNHIYQPVYGIPELIEAISQKLQADNDIIIDMKKKIFVTAGANMGFMNAILAITDPGDEIILPVPYYFNFDMAAALANCRVVRIPTDERFQIMPDAIAAAINSRTRAVITISPNNPCGTVYPRENLQEINTICQDKGIYHISDEAYEYFVYDNSLHSSPGSYENSCDHTISLFSLSKSYGFASWRMGYMVIPEHLFKRVCKIQDTILICPPVVSQWAAVGALKAGSAYCKENVHKLAVVRQNVMEQLDQIEDIVSYTKPEGAFYIFIRIHTNMDAMVLTERLIREYHVAVIPAGTFGYGEGCAIRISYGALDGERVSEGMARLVRGLREIVSV
jgi:aspartate/methionine/tyrosine aminotransferase